MQVSRDDGRHRSEKEILTTAAICDLLLKPVLSSVCCEDHSARVVEPGRRRVGGIEKRRSDGHTGRQTNASYVRFSHVDKSVASRVPPQ